VTTTEVIALDFSVYNGFGLKTTKPAWKINAWRFWAGACGRRHE